LVESQAGSGIYVKEQGQEGGPQGQASILKQYPEAYKIVQKSLDELLSQGCSLREARELFLSEIDWRLRCSARVLVTVPNRDLEAGKLMIREIEQSLGIPVELVPLEELSTALDQTNSGTVVTSRYFIGEVLSVAAPKSVRVIPVDIHDYAQELEIVKDLPKDSCLGVVSLSAGTLGVASIIIHSLRGEELLLMTAQVDDTYKLNALVRAAQTIISDHASYDRVKAAISAARDDLIRPPKLIRSENYIGTKSINLLKRELGLG